MTAQDGFPPILLRKQVVSQPGEGHEPGDRLLGNLLLKQRLRLRLGPDLHRVLIRDHLPAHERLRQPEHRVDHHLVPLARDRMAGVGDSGRSRREKGLKHHRHGRNDAPPSQSLMIGKGRRGPERGPAFDDGGRNRLLQHPQDCSVDAGKRGLLLVFVRGRRTDRPQRRLAEAQGGQFEVESLLERAWQGERSNPAPPLVQQGDHAMATITDTSPIPFAGSEARTAHRPHWGWWVVTAAVLLYSGMAVHLYSPAFAAAQALVTTAVAWVFGTGARRLAERNERLLELAATLRDQDGIATGSGLNTGAVEGETCVSGGIVEADADRGMPAGSGRVFSRQLAHTPQG